MTDYKTKAEAYVRQQLPELMKLSFGCEVVVDVGESGRWKALVTGLMSNGCWRVNLLEAPVDEADLEIIGHPIQLQHWLNCLHPKIGPDAKIEAWIGNRIKIWTGKTKILFNLTTGQPASEADYQAFCKIVGVE